MRNTLRCAILGGLCLAGAAGASAANLNHYYDFSSGVTDLAGTANGTLFDNASVSGGALHLDGNGDYAEFGTIIVPTAGSYSVALFARGNAVQSGYTELISQGYSGGPGFYLGTDGGGTLMRATDSWITTGVPFGAPNVWTHYALVVDAGANTSRLYVNGNQAGPPLPLAIVTAPSGSPTRLGRQFAPYGEFFNGAIDEVRTYDGVLTPQEVAVLASVPEAGTAGMALGGLAALGAVLRRRRCSAGLRA